MAGWFVVFALLLVLAARLFWWDSRASLVALNALTPVLFVPAWPVALGAAIGRRFRLAGVAALVVVGHITLMLPEVAASKSTLPAARPAPSFTLFDANVLVGNADVAGYAEELRRQAPDVVMLQESTPTFLAALEETGALRELPHRVAVSRSDPFAAMLASRWPLREEDVLYADGRSSRRSGGRSWQRVTSTPPGATARSAGCSTSA